ncbi:MAG: hypothetical protein GY866_18375 [Proteobacteria bacterium]|nr:hypothetical protein [Pseudomonadota bacterium]
MIVSMKKLSLLIYHKEKESFLKSLQEMGIVHIVDNPEVDHPESVSEPYRKAVGVSRSCERAIDVLSKVKARIKTDADGEKAGKRSLHKAEEVLKTFAELESEKENLQQNLADVEKNMTQLQPWGDFNPEIIGELEKKGIDLRFFEIAPKKYGAIDFGEVHHAVVGQTKNLVRFLVFERGDRLELEEANEVNLPMKSLAKLAEEAASLENQGRAVDEEFGKLTATIDILTEYKTRNDNVAAFAAAGVNMVEQVDGKILSLTGWFPAEREKRVSDFLDGYRGYYKIDDPDEEDDVPVLLRNNRITRLFEPITKIYSLPSYRELDPTPFFAPFFALYFGLCLGDVGYGAMTCVIAAIFYFKGPKKYRNFGILGLILGGLTIMSGVLLNSFFGQAVFHLQGNREYFFKSDIGSGLSFLGSFVDSKQMTVFPAMGFAIVLGVVQVLLGIALQCINRIRQRGLVWGIHPASFFMMIVGTLFTIGFGESGFIGVTGIDISTYKLGALNIGSWLIVPPMEFGLFLIVLGLVLMFLFNNPDKKIFLRPLTGLWELYGFCTAIVGDILSYLRLFALGLASGLLGNAFNGIAFKFIENGIFPGIIATVALLVFAHTLNFGLAILGSFVHPLRLTFVEFYKNLDFEGGGKDYAPFLIEKNPMV